jgi:hypothetical protein
MDVSSEPRDEKEALSASYGVLEEEGGDESKVEIYKANPELFRNLKYVLQVTADVISPKSEDLERALNLEAFDRAIQLPFTNQEVLAKDLLFGSYDKTKRDVNRYIKQEGQPINPLEKQMPIPGQIPNPPAPITSGNVMSRAPMANVSKRMQTNFNK